MTVPASLVPYLVSPFSQSVLIRDMQLDHVRNGFCLMLAMTWVMQSRQLGDPRMAFTQVTTDHALLRQMANNQSNVFKREYGLWRGDYNQSMDEVTTFMTRRGGMSATIDGIDLTGLAVIRGKGIIIIEFPVARMRMFGYGLGTRTAGHAIGVYTQGTDVYIFDPNYGLFRTNAATPEPPVQALWTEYGVTKMSYAMVQLP